MKELGIYIHIPFCKKKCSYCDFISHSNKNNLIEKYINALKTEIIQNFQNIRDYEISTIYIGGGTPSYINSKYIVEILNVIKKKYNIKQKVEVTIEVNPGTVNEEKLQDYANIGINRLSIGLQTTNDKLLKVIGRIHQFEDFLKTYNLARKLKFENINIDLMIGLPMQTVRHVNEDLEKILKLNPEHISVYSLIVETNTKIEKEIQEGSLQLPTEETEREEYWFVKNKLEEARLYTL